MDSELLSSQIFYERGYFAKYPDAEKAVSRSEFNHGREHWDSVGAMLGYDALWVSPAEIDEQVYFRRYPEVKKFIASGKDSEVICAGSYFRRYGNRQGHLFFRREEFKNDESDKISSHPMRFVTTLETSYVPAFIALLQSMKERSQISFRFAIIDYGLTDEDKDRILKMRVEIDWFPREVLGDFIIDPKTSLEPRMWPNLWKPLMWLLPYEENLMYIDADVLCLNSLGDISSLVPLSVVVNQSSVGVAPDEDENYKPSGIWPFNAGIMLYRPNPSIYYEMQDFALREYQDRTIRYGDQIIQNDFFASCRPDLVHYMDVCWNFSVLLTKRQPQLYNSSRVRLLHWAQETKPWLHDPPEEWMQIFWDLWREFYNRAGV